jgi:hypothetical protein
LTPEEKAKLSLLCQWANDPKRFGATSEQVAEWVRVLFARCAQLADLIPEVERHRLDLEQSERAPVAYRCENVRLRALLNGQNPAPWESSEE